MGIAFGFNVEFDRGVESLNNAIFVLQKRIDNLKAGKHDKGLHYISLDQLVDGATDFFLFVSRI